MTKKQVKPRENRKKEQWTGKGYKESKERKAASST